MKKKLVKDNKKVVRRIRKLIDAVKIHGVIIGVCASLMQVKLIRNLWCRMFGQPVIEINVMGFNMYVDLSDPGLSWQLISRGCREVEHGNDIREHLRPGMTGIDLGANIGYFALMEATIIGPTGRLYCVEPVSKNVELLRKNIKRNSFTDIVNISQNIVGSEKKRLRITLSDASNSHRVMPGHNESFSKNKYEEVEAVSVDEFMELNNLRPEDIDFLRCDIEGYEVVAFSGMKKILESKTPFHLFIELHPDVYPEFGTSVEDVVKQLFKAGFKFRKIIKEFPATDGRTPKVEILKTPSVEEYLRQQEKWSLGGVQVHLERV